MKQVRSLDYADLCQQRRCQIAFPSVGSTASLQARALLRPLARAYSHI
jgi:hypothetical protein